MNQNLKILLLEDFPADAEMVIYELGKGNIKAETLVVDNKPDFTKALNEFSPDLILSDHSLPAFSSIEALKILKESNLHIPFILVTATVSEEFAVKVLKEGADDYILKNNLTRLPSSIGHVIQRRNAQKAEEKAKQELHDAHNRLFFHLENSPLGYIEWEAPEMLIKTMSRRAEEIFGMSENEFKTSNRAGHLQVYEEDLPYITKMAEQLISGKVKNNTAQNRNLKKDGSVIWCEWFNSALTDMNGNVTTIMSLVQDITQRKKDEEELHISEERYRQIVETAQEGIWTIDEKDKTNFVNDKICRILEYSPEEMIGKKLFDFMDEKGKQMASELIELQKKEPKDSYEFAYITKTGRKIWTNVSTNAIFGKNNKYLGALAMVTDITERKLSELETFRLVQNLQTKNRELRQFAYMVSHNLRAPIAKIQGLASLFESSKEDNSFIMALLDTITSEAENLDEVVKDMNTIITAGDSANQGKENVFFETKVDQIKRVLENEISESGASITTDFRKAERVFTVKSYIYSIIYNLLSNAIKYRRSDVPLQIHLQTFEQDNFICLTVQDNGTGIDLNRYKDKLFGLYKRFHGNEIPGRGVGLSLVKTQAESLGGRVEVESQVNVGTSFKIFLPKQVL